MSFIAWISEVRRLATASNITGQLETTWLKSFRAGKTPAQALADAVANQATA